MLLAPIITIRDIPHSDAIESHIKRKIEKLDQYYNRIMHCDVVIEQDQKNKHTGKIYNTRITLTVPGDEITVTRAKNEDVYVSTRDAFRAATRKLQDFARKKRRKQKKHAIAQHGEITRIFADEGYGFIRSNGDEYYFSFSNIAHPDFSQLDIGTKVQFLPSEGSDGLQAQRICVGKHHSLIDDEEEY